MQIDYSKIRGFNYLPSYAGSLQMVWTHFDRSVWEREVPWSKRFGTNMLRVWLDWHAWCAIEEEMFDALDAALDVLSRNGISMMPVIFNRWNDNSLPMGLVSDQDITVGGYRFQKFKKYVTGLIRRFGEDDRVAIWDLCNDPQAPANSAETNFREVVWLSRIADWVRRGTSKPITISTMLDDFVRIYAPMVDVISFHPYTMKRGDMEELCTVHKAIAGEYKKPLICTEACKGSLDDQERGEQARDDVETMNRHGIGWLLWMLVEGRFITGTRERPDNNSLHPDQGYMPFILKDGTTRPGHEWLEKL
jgi:hypothetical protein